MPNPRALVVVISQSGETADTLAALHHAKAPRPAALARHLQRAESALVRNAALKFLTRAGPEIGVASTKAFTAQLAALLLLAVTLGEGARNDLPKQEVADAARRCAQLPAAMASALRVEPEMAAWAAKFAQLRARPVPRPRRALPDRHGRRAEAEGDLLHPRRGLRRRRAEARPARAGRRRACRWSRSRRSDALLDKLKSNLQEVRARGGELYVLAHRDAGLAAGTGVHVIEMPDCPGVLSPIVSTVPLQLLAYHAALLRGNDVDKPRNLAKSVTVE